MSKQCPFCIEARTEAAKQVYKWLVATKEAIRIPRGYRSAVHHDREKSGDR